MSVSSLPFNERLETIRSIADDPKITSLISELISCISRYHETVINMQRLPVCVQRCMDSTEVKEVTERFDRQKRLAHNRLLDAITITNRYLFRRYGKSIPAGGVYTDDPLHLYGNKDRNAIASWAVKVSATLNSTLH